MATNSSPTNIYEGLFLFPQSAAGNLEGAVEHIRDLLGRADAEIISLDKWDERRLAFEIRGNKRGIYFLTYFRAPATSLSDLERSCNLSEQLLRSMVTRADHIPAEVIEAADGQARLADEIRLRQEKSESTPAPEPAPTPAPEPAATAPAEGDATA
ncbi:MAG: 30S ribosomal protein S6 [Planctomycetota bacterium]|jgi:small subunit ribosomal protein S6